jgi:DNA repair exonuclease SbcCD nuclease subunit
MRILSIGDVHADKRLFGFPRFDEVEAVMLRSVDVAIERKVDLYEFGGDLADPDSGVCVFRCVRLALECARRLSLAGILSTWLSGNHDVVEDGSGDTTLTPLRALQATGDRVVVLERPGWVQLGNGLQLLALPYTATSHTYNPEAFVRDTWAKRAEGGKVVTTLHLGIEGVQPGEETKEMSRGRDVLYPQALVASKGAQAAAQLAHHYHRRQDFRGIHVVGAPARFAFGERENEPSFTILEV